MDTERIKQMKELSQKIQAWDMKYGNVPQDWLDEYGNLWAEELKEKNCLKEVKSKHGKK